MKRGQDREDRSYPANTETIRTASSLAGRLRRLRTRLDRRRLSVQMIASFVGLVLLTAIAASLPALWLIRSQLDRQAWDQVEQGRLAAQALYAARQSELDSLATLTAQRPTLHDLLVGSPSGELEAYLTTLQQGSGLDLVLVCSDDQEPFSTASGDLGVALCASGTQPGPVVIPRQTGPQAWLLAAHPLPAAPKPATSGTVWVGLHLDDEFALQMQTQTGLAHRLLADGQSLASSSPDEDLAGRDYYTGRFPLDRAGLEAEVALNVSGLAATTRNATWSLLGSLLAAVMGASLLGTILARRISSPLADLARAVGAWGAGADAGPGVPAEILDNPLAVEARVREVTLVAQALEAARRELKQSVTALHQEKIWTDHLLEAIVEGIVTLDRQGHVTFFSHGAERISGWRRDEVVGKTCDQIFVPLESDQPFSQLIPSPGRKHKIPVEMRDGRQAILAITGARLVPPTGGEARVALVFRDVSEEEAVHRLLGHFLANVAHEFRTPLSALAASVELLLDQAPDLNPQELAELLTSLHLGVLGLQTLIDNLLESASIETGHFQVRPRRCDLSEIVAEAVNMLQPLLDKHGQSLVVGLPATMPTVRADPRRTVQVLINLLSNASKYGPDDAEIEVSAAVEGAWVRVSVADAGPGVPAEHRQRLFLRFAHPPSPNDKAQVGAGLGLSVVKAVVEAHGGQTGVEERPAGGSIFWFTLPRADVPAEEGALPVKGALPTKGGLPAETIPTMKGTT